MRLVTIKRLAPHILTAIGPVVNNEIPPATESTLVCPHCGGGQLHQLAVEVYFRKEDATHGINATVFGTAEICTTSSSQERNPSPRRDGVRIRFTCEHCPKEPALAIIQHKGDTEMFWEMA